MKGISAGQKVEVVISRNKKERTATVVTSVFPKSLAMDLAYGLLGVSVEDLTGQTRRKYRTDEKEGVIISTVRKGSQLNRIGVQPGDIIRKIDDITTKDTEDFKKAVIKYRKKSSVVLLLQRGNQLYYITVKLGSS